MSRLVAEKVAEFTLRCPECGTEHHRSMWSIAHMNEPQTLNCSCGERLYVPAEPFPRPE